MAFSINTFRSNALNNAGARANLFDVTMTGAPAAGLNASEFTFACKAAQIPSSAVGVVEVPYFGRVVKVPGNKTFENWTVTIINDEGFEIRNAMEKWITAMGTHEGNVATISAGDGTLYGQATVNQYAKAGGTVLEAYNFVNIFPINVAAIDLAWETNDAIEDFTVEFAYDYWTHGTIVT
jgi:L-arabinose isomerase